MRNFLRYAVKGLALVVGLFVAGAALIYLLVPSPPPVPATTRDDPSLPRLQADGLPLHGLLMGPEGAPLVIVLHGGPGGDLRSLQPLGALSDRYRVLLYDQRGAGLSPRLPDRDLTLDTHLDELRALADTYSPDRPVHLVGHSWGAILGAAYLGRDPARVASAVLIEPGFLDAAGYDAWQAQADALIADSTRSPSGLWRTLGALVASLHVRGPDDHARDDYFMGEMVAAFVGHPDNPYHCPNAEYDAPGWRVGARAMRAVPAQASAQDLNAIAAGVRDYPGPVLFLVGGCDGWLGRDLQQRHAALFRSAQVVEIAEAGHDVVHDRPMAALAEIRGFLRKTR